MRSGLQLMRFLLLLASRATLIVAVAVLLAAAWGYYGYQRIGCHPMFSSTDIECGTVQVLAAEHSLALAKTLAPYQQQLQDNQTNLIILAGTAVIGAVVIEVIFGFVAIVRRRRAERDMFKGATAVKEKTD